MEEKELDRIRQIVHTLQPKAEIIDCNYGDVELDKILHTHLFDFNEVATSATWIQELEKRHDEDDHDKDDHHHEEEHHHHDEDHDTHADEHGEGHHHHHHHHHHDGGEAEEYGIGTYVYYRRQPMDFGLFDEFVARKWPSNVIRAKGLCYFDNERENCYLFEQAGKQVSVRNAGRWYATMPQEELEDLMQREPKLVQDWDPVYGDRMQKIVFIGQNLDKKKISEDLDKCLSE